jgi:thiol:disulfide interchange protein DsbD
VPKAAPARWLAVLLLLLTLAAGAAQAGAVVETEHVRAELISEAAAVRPGQTFWVALRFDIRPGWHTYWKNPGDSGEAPRIRWRLPEGFRAGEVHWPPPQRLPLGPLMNFGYAGEAWLLVPMTAPGRIEAGTVELAAAATWLVCKEECIPEQGEFALTLPVTADEAAATSWAEAFAEVRRRLPQTLDGAMLAPVDADTLRLELGPALRQVALREAWFFPDAYGLVEHAAPQLLSSGEGGPVLQLRRGELRGAPPDRLTGVLVVTEDLPDGPMATAFSIDAPAAGPAAGGIGLAAALLLALAGGFLLNLMPCVFPVLSLKALHLVEQSRAGTRAVRLGGLAFTAGVLLAFLAIALALLALRASGEAIGWGFQLQSPAFVLALAWLTFALGLWLSGVWSFGEGLMGLGQGLAEQRGALGAFFTGVLAVVVATPCTAPFMGAALGYALTQPAAYALGVFLALGLGLALPWLLLALFPTLRRVLPRPGAWMERFKQLLAFPMYATSAWLVWVLSQQSDARGLAYALAGLLTLALALWLWQASRAAAPAWRRLGGAIGLAALGLLAGLLLALPDGRVAGGAPPAGPAEAYSAARLAELRAAGRPVLINFTAAWCITCQVNERVALSTQRVGEAMRTAGVAYLKADWTRRDPAITRLLEAHRRSGVPMYLLYPAGGGEPELLPSVLTEDLVLARLAGAVAARAADATVPGQP